MKEVPLNDCVPVHTTDCFNCLQLQISVQLCKHKTQIWTNDSLVISIPGLRCCHSIDQAAFNGVSHPLLKGVLCCIRGVGHQQVCCSSHPEPRTLSLLTFPLSCSCLSILVLLDIIQLPRSTFALSMHTSTF